MPPVAFTVAASLAVGLGVVTTIALVTWFALLGLVMLRTRPRDAAAGPATMELGGEEPPAVVNLIIDWKLTPSAIPATLIDLSARGFVSIEGTGRACVVRLGRGGDGPLTEYEQQVLDHVRGLVRDGVVPAAALSTGPQIRSREWWKRFRSAVIDDAKRRGLVRSRLSPALLGTLGTAALIPAISGSTWMAAYETSRGNSPDIEEFFGITFLIWALLFACIPLLRTERETPAGLVAQSRWKGLRNYLATNEQFPSLPPSAVAVWERLLGYGAAMGVAAGAVRGLPLGAESASLAWSDSGGRWHEIRIRYPNPQFLAWGRRPAFVLAGAIAWLLGSLLVAVSFLPPMTRLLFELGPVNGSVAVVLSLIAFLLYAVIVLAVVIAGGRAVILISKALPDLREEAVIEGPVLRVTQHHLAVDDGQREVSALYLGERSSPVEPGDVVRARVTPRLRYVKDIKVIEAQPA